MIESQTPARLLAYHFVADRFDCRKCRAEGERGKRDTMNPRSCHWLIVSALVITASGAWAQQSAPPASDQALTTGRLSETPKAAQCSSPPAFDEKSIAAFKKQATSGDAAAQCGLGLMYEEGKGVPPDYTQAVVWYRKAAELGNADAQFNLGYF